MGGDGGRGGGCSSLQLGMKWEMEQVQALFGFPALSIVVDSYCFWFLNNRVGNCTVTSRHDPLMSVLRLCLYVEACAVTCKFKKSCLPRGWSDSC